jgi:hypothetical protein
MKTIRFSKDFKKLDDPYFPTIRKKSKGLNTGRYYMIKTPTKEFQAILIVQNKVRFCEIPELTLYRDTEVTSREGALEAMREYYPGLKETDQVMVYWFTKPKEDLA